MGILIFLLVLLLAHVVVGVAVRLRMGPAGVWWKYLCLIPALLVLLWFRIRNWLEARRVWRLRRAARVELAMSNRVGPLPVGGRTWPR